MDQLRDENAHIYMCFQSIQKMQPTFDHVLVDILIADPEAQIALQASRSSIQTTTLQQRLQAVLRERLCGLESIECTAMADAYSRVHFLPRVTSDEVLALMQKSSVVLHPFPVSTFALDCPVDLFHCLVIDLGASYTTPLKFGGSKTASDALNAGVPLVTYPQRYLRGRMASVFIKALDLGEADPDAASCCIASSVSDYVSKALRLASDTNYRTLVVNAIQQRSDRIFNEKMIGVEWGKLLTRALGIRMNEEEIRSQVGFVPEQRHYEAYISKAVEDEQLRWRKSVMLGNILGAH